MPAVVAGPSSAARAFAGAGRELAGSGSRPARMSRTAPITDSVAGSIMCSAPAAL